MDKGGIEPPPGIFSLSTPICRAVLLFHYQLLAALADLANERNSVSPRPKPGTANLASTHIRHIEGRVTPAAAVRQGPPSLHQPQPHRLVHSYELRPEFIQISALDYLCGLSREINSAPLASGCSQPAEIRRRICSTILHTIECKSSGTLDVRAICFPLPPRRAHSYVHCLHQRRHVMLKSDSRGAEPNAVRLHRDEA